jgi:hypothetical protein
MPRGKRCIIGEANTDMLSPVPAQGSKPIISICRLRLYVPSPTSATYADPALIASPPISPGPACGACIAASFGAVRPPHLVLRAAYVVAVLVLAAAQLLIGAEGARVACGVAKAWRCAWRWTYCQECVGKPLKLHQGLGGEVGEVSVAHPPRRLQYNRSPAPRRPSGFVRGRLLARGRLCTRVEGSSHVRNSPPKTLLVQKPCA